MGFACRQLGGLWVSFPSGFGKAALNGGFSTDYVGVSAGCERFFSRIPVPG